MRKKKEPADPNITRFKESLKNFKPDGLEIILNVKILYPG